jgi:hypothetical protein
MEGFCSVGIAIIVISESKAWNSTPAPRTLDCSDPVEEATNCPRPKLISTNPGCSTTRRFDTCVVRPHRPFYVANYHRYH